MLDSGRYVFSGDVGCADAADLPGYDTIRKNPSNGRVEYGQIFTSDDKGKTWQRRAVRNFCHARPFAVGNTVYLPGHSGDLVPVSRSGDKDAFSAHNGNIATFHRVKDFRNLVY